MLKLKLQYFGHLMRRADPLDKILILGKIEGRKRGGQQRTKWLDDITNAMKQFEQALGDGGWQGRLACCSPWSHKEWDRTEQLNNNNNNNMEQCIGSKLGIKYCMIVYCHTAYLNYMQSTPCKMPGWISYKLESSLQGEIWTTSVMQMTPL